MRYYAVTRERGPAWDPALPMRKQERWKNHAVFMDGLADAGVIIMGGPLGEGETTFLLIFNVDSEESVVTTLANDPWTEMVSTNCEN
jgi:hypothetical protein